MGVDGTVTSSSVVVVVVGDEGPRIGEECVEDATVAVVEGATVSFTSSTFTLADAVWVTSAASCFGDGGSEAPSPNVVVATVAFIGNSLLSAAVGVLASPSSSSRFATACAGFSATFACRPEEEDAALALTAMAMMPCGGLTFGPNESGTASRGSGGLIRLLELLAGGGANVGGVGGGCDESGVNEICAAVGTGLGSGVGTSGGAGPSEWDRTEGEVARDVGATDGDAAGGRIDCADDGAGDELSEIWLSAEWSGGGGETRFTGGPLCTGK